MLKKVRNDRIDKQRWDWAIANCDNPHVYMLSWYLDVVSPGWQALVYDDYKFILPLPVKYRYSIPYLVQPLFSQRLAISGIGVTNELARKFYRRLFWQFPYYNLQIDNFIGLEKRRYLRGRINYTLDLTPSYDLIVRDYHENTVRNLKKATHANLKTEDWDSAGFTAFCTLWARGISPSQVAVLSALVDAAIQHRVARIVRVTHASETVAAACFLVWNNRVLYLAGASSSPGRDSSAMFLIFDNIIREYAQSGYLLDFEGSMLPGVAKFFRGFGAKSSYYYSLKKCLFVYR